MPSPMPRVFLTSTVYVVGVETTDNAFYLLGAEGEWIGHDLASAIMFRTQSAAEEFAFEQGQGVVYRIEATALLAR